MSFVHPLLLGGLILVGIPVLLHLVMRQKPKHLPFPAMRFLLQRHRTNQRKLQLRHLVLLALRILLIALVCLALARPKIFSERFNLFGDRPVAAVFVFDTSYSMEYASGGRSRLDDAKRRALELLDDLPENSRVAILDTAEPGGEWLPLSVAPQERIARLQLRPANLPVTSQIGHAYELLAKPPQQDRPEETPPLCLYVFSDRTLACWDTGQLQDLLQERDHIPPPGVHGVFVDVGVEKPMDLAVTNLDMPRQVIPANDRVVIRATVQATGEGCDTEAVCRIDGKEPADRKPVKLEAGQSQVISFERRGLSEGWHQAEIVLNPADPDLLFDNALYASFQVRGARQVLVIADEPDNAVLWKEALNSGGAFGCEVVSTADAGKLFAGDLRSHYQAVCLLDVARPANDLWDKLATFVKNGGGLAVLPGGSELQPEAYNQGEYARQLMPGKLVKVVGAGDEKAGVDWDWKGNDFQHPLMKPFQEWRREGNVDFVQFPRGAFRYWEVQPLDQHDASVVVSYDDKKNDKEERPAILERLFNKNAVRGRVLLFTTPLDGRRPRWNNYMESLTSFYVVLAQLTAGYLAGDAEDGSFNHQSGQAVPVVLPPLSPVPTTYTIQGPGLTGSEALVSRVEDKGDLLLTQAVMPGNYGLFDADGKPTAFFSINVPPGECRLERVPVEQIEALLGPGAVLSPDQKVSLKDAMQEHWKEPRELLPLLMVLVLFGLALESLLANKFYRRQPEGQPETPALERAPS